LRASLLLSKTAGTGSHFAQFTSLEKSIIESWKEKPFGFFPNGLISFLLAAFIPAI